MNAIILYAQTNPRLITDSHQRIETTLGPIWIRAYTRTSEESLMNALDKADPTHGEVVLNSIEYPAQ